MNVDVMVLALATKQEKDLAAAEQILVDYYDEKTLRFGIMRFYGHDDFRKRMRLVELAKEDYLAGRFHACVPLLLSLLDGLVNDITKHVGFFSKNVNLTAWDSIAAHESGLSSIAKIMGASRNKTSEVVIRLPYRHGILHGRELAFDNQLVAAKCWAAMFAVRDWAAALADGKANPKPKEKLKWSKIFERIAENARVEKMLKDWKSRQSSDLAHLPNNGPAAALPAATPERAVAEFIDHWIRGRYGLMVDLLLDFSDESRGRRAGQAKEDFGRRKPASYMIVGASDQAPSISHVEVDLGFQDQHRVTKSHISVRVIYQSSDNQPLPRGHENGRWVILQGSFGAAINPNTASSEASTSSET